MFKPQMKFQKTLFLCLLIFSAVVFVYSLGVMTDVYGLYQVKAVMSVKGGELFDDMQGYNNTLVLIAIALILVSALPFLVASNTRRKYYVGNVVATGLQAGLYVIAAVYMVINSLKYRAQFVNTVDFASYKMIAEQMKFNYSESTFFFDAGIVLAVLLIVAAGLVIYNLIWKKNLVKQEDAILRGEVSNG